MDEAKKHRARVNITVEFEIVDPTALRSQNLVNSSDGEPVVWNQTDEEAARQVLTDLALNAWMVAASKVGLARSFGCQSHVVPPPGEPQDEPS